jgi:predicted nucleic acid-binding protein
MADLFADTSGWGNLIDSSHPYYMLAANLYRTTRQQGHKVVTTNYILAELVALLTSPLRITRSSIIAIIDGLRNSPHVEIVHVDASVDEQAWQLFKNRPDKEWSLVDCASFVVMRQPAIAEALTADHHFDQAGFVRLLK